MKSFIKLGVLLVIVVVVSNSGYRLRSQKKFDKTTVLSKIREGGSQGIIPEFTLQSSTDTLLSNSFEVHTRVFTKIDKVLKIKTNRNGFSEKVFYRKFDSVIRVCFRDKEIFNERLIAGLFSKKENDNSYWQKAILRELEIDQLNSSSNSIQMYISFQNPITEHRRQFNLRVLSDGNYTLTEV